MVIDMDKCDLEGVIIRQYSSILKQMHFENQFLKWLAKKMVQVCAFMPGSLIFVWLLICKICSGDLSHADIDYCSLGRLWCDWDAYLLTSKGWKLKMYVAIYYLFRGTFRNMCSTSERKIWIYHRAKDKNSFCVSKNVWCRCSAESRREIRLSHASDLAKESANTFSKHSLGSTNKQMRTETHIQFFANLCKQGTDL